MIDWQTFVLELRETISQQAAVIEDLKGVIAKQQVIIESQNVRINQLEQEVRTLRNRKNSGNSSLPPSMDMSKPAPKPNQSLRLKSNKKSGGQPGHKGETLKLNPLPDKIEILLPTVCSGCSYNLEKEQARLIGRRQVVDIPPIKPIYTEYQQFERTCPCCKLPQQVPFPAHVQAPIQYGPHVMSVVAYLHTRQFLPLKRSKELMNSLLGLSISEGSIVNLLDKMVEKAMPVYERIKQNILGSGFAGADETGCKVNGKKQWFWTIQNERSTFIWLSPTRGFDSIEEEFGNRLKDLILVHDCWAAYFQTNAKAHQLCLAHLSRDLNLTQLYPKEKWAESIQNLFSKALKLKDKMVDAPPEGWIKSRNDLEEKLRETIHLTLKVAGKEVVRLQKRLKKHLKNLTTFLHHKHIPPDNNGSERAIRNVKVKLKVSGQFKSEKGADSFAVLRSVVDTLIKNERDVFQSLATLAAW
jgi:transposase